MHGKIIPTTLIQSEIYSDNAYKDFQIPKIFLRTLTENKIYILVHKKSDSYGV
jgi:hypothetical protein